MNHEKHERHKKNLYNELPMKIYKKYSNDYKSIIKISYYSFSRFS